MTKLATLLGSQYESKRKGLFIRQFELGGYNFKVKVPTVAESDAIYDRIQNPKEEDVSVVYEQIAKPLEQFRDKETEQFKFVENDILVEGRSLRETARLKLITQTRITEFIKLLIPENEKDSLADLTYEEVEAEFPMTVQITLLEKISEVISPSYKESRGN
jgi:hypothetical protein